MVGPTFLNLEEQTTYNPSTPHTLSHYTIDTYESQLSNVKSNGQHIITQVSFHMYHAQEKKLSNNT